MTERERVEDFEKRIIVLMEELNEFDRHLKPEIKKQGRPPTTELIGVAYSFLDYARGTVADVAKRFEKE